MHILGSQNVYSRAVGIADHYRPVFYPLSLNFPLSVSASSDVAVIVRLSLSLSSLFFPLYRCLSPEKERNVVSWSKLVRIKTTVPPTMQAKKIRKEQHH